jgi:hypothetical protein
MTNRKQGRVYIYARNLNDRKKERDNKNKTDIKREKEKFISGKNNYDS